MGGEEVQGEGGEGVPLLNPLLNVNPAQADPAEEDHKGALLRGLGSDIDEGSWRYFHFS